jgi:predicted dehydrogenase
MTQTSNRRDFIAMGAGGLAAAAFAGSFSGTLRAESIPTLRWGIVGTGMIANAMAPQIATAPHGVLAAVSSRSMDKANEFAGKHGAAHAFDSWADLVASDAVDAVYVATPTSVREEICLAAANAGKHVLGEKPFFSLPSVRRIAAACRDNGVGFMDGTHFVHHPRSLQIQARQVELIGPANSLTSAFQFGIRDTSNIRLRPDLEPMGAIGDAGWYNMKAIATYLPQWYAGKVEVASVYTVAHREPVNNAVNRAAGVIKFSDGATSTWNCSFESGGFVQDVQITGSKGILRMDDYISHRSRTEPASYDVLGGGGTEIVEVEADRPASAQMFEDMALMVGDSAAFEASVRTTERTQALLDAVWASALENGA